MAHSRLRVVVADDEPPARGELRHLLEETGLAEVVAEAASAQEALAAIVRCRPDVVYLDVRMPGLSGMDLASTLGQLGRPPAVVFATAYESYAVQAFGVGAADYILKPFEPQQVLRSLLRTRERLLIRLRGRNPVPIPVLGDGCIRFLRPESLVYVRARGKHCLVRACGQEYVSRLSLQELEGRLPPQFMRVHRSYIVNLHRVIEVSPWVSGSVILTLEDGARVRVPVGRTYIVPVRTALGI
ncbi:MAG: LytTR family DNA-binding domain-containing protein [Bacillota bacterium]